MTMDVENAFRGAKQDSVAMSFSRLPAATIRAGGTTRSMLQEACDVGGDIILTAGRLYGPPACAVITKPVNIVGDGTVLSAAGVADKGILVVNADTRLVALDISGARVIDDNGAGVRLQTGSLTLAKHFLLSGV